MDHAQTFRHPQARYEVVRSRQRVSGYRCWRSHGVFAPSDSDIWRNEFHLGLGRICSSVSGHSLFRLVDIRGFFIDDLPEMRLEVQLAQNEEGFDEACRTVRQRSEELREHLFLHQPVLWLQAGE